MGNVGNMTGKIIVIERNSEEIVFQYKDGALSGKYHFMLGDGDYLNSLFNKNFMKVGTETTQRILSDAIEEGVVTI